jgi:hypothetical protein
MRMNLVGILTAPVINPLDQELVVLSRKLLYVRPLVVPSVSS